MRDAHELRVGVSDVCVSAQYDSQNSRYDLALITLARRVKFNNYIQPACLPRQEQLIHTYGPQSRCFLVGAGAIRSYPSNTRPVQIVDVSSPVVNKLRAENVACTTWGFGEVDYDRVCYTRARNLVGDSCHGDSGGPILCLDEQRRWTVMASVSYGPTYCQHNRVAVYARIRNLLVDLQQECGIRFF